jgi:cell division protease FtsH
MDGLVSNRGIVVLAATNRYEVLDPALVRPGRFDRVVRVELPDLAGRRAILAVHAHRGSVRLDPRAPDAGGVSLDRCAAETRGLAGAELAALVNEAAIRAARESRDYVMQRDFDAAIATYFASRQLGSVDSQGANAPAFLQSLAEMQGLRQPNRVPQQPQS